MTGSQVRVLFAAPRFSKNSFEQSALAFTDALRDLSHIKNRLPGIVSASTSRGDTNMRKFILIAGFVLASAAAQAGDRSLSLGGVETKPAPAPAKAMDASKTAEVPQAAEAPKYVERPAVVEPKPETSKAETSRAETSRTETARPRAARMQRYATRPASAGPGRPCGPESCVNVEERGTAPHALRDPGAHHPRTAPARHLLVIPPKQNAPLEFESEERVFHRVRPEAGERLPANPYCETVCTTLLIGRLATAGTFWSFTSIASYSGKVSSCSLAFICTTL